MKIQIKNKWSNSVLFETDAESLGSAIIAALAAKADLRDADLRGADLRGAVLRGAVLTDADLTGADLRGAVLTDADLRDADLRDADLTDADLRGAVLRGAVLTDAALKAILATRTILPDGDLIGWKKLQDGTLCKLRIPANAKRVGGLIGRKCRAEYAVVLEGDGQGLHNGHVYKVGETVKPDKYDDNPFVECSHGIHFFITKQEAQDYQ